MEPLYIVGGEQKPDAVDKQEFQGFRRGLVLRLDVEKREGRIVFEYESPAEVLPDDDPSTLLKAATVEGDRIYLCTPTEIITCEFPSFKRIGYLSLPPFNDVHHVRPTSEGNLLVTNTGLDMVHLVSPNGETVREWDVLGEPPWSRFDRDTDYRKVPSTKPHKSHPNYTFTIGGELWVTRLHQRDALCLQTPGKRIDIGIEKPHDGIVCGNNVYFTTVDGHVARANTDSLCVEASYKVARQLRKPAWCRGLHVIDNRLAVIGFSRLRRTPWQDNVRWATGGIKALKDLATSPTSIVLLDLATGKVVWNIPVEKYGLSAIFSIHSGQD
jgi:hypothetical protein